jgi:putative transposase
MDLAHAILDLVLRLVVATREVQIAGIIAESHGRWMKQMARNLTNGLDGFLQGCRYLVHDRAGLFSRECGMILEAAGIESVRQPAHAPNLIAIAERFVRSIKEDCLDLEAFSRI